MLRTLPRGSHTEHSATQRDAPDHLHDHPYVVYLLVSVGFLSLICSIMWQAKAGTRQKTDVIYMKNGDRITCEIKKLEYGQLEMKAHMTRAGLSLIGQRSRESKVLRPLWSKHNQDHILKVQYRPWTD